MKITPFEGCWYGEGLPSGEFAFSELSGWVVRTHLGDLVPPLKGPLYTRMTDVGGFQIAGQPARRTDGDVTLLYKDGTWHTPPPLPFGTGSTIFDNNGVLHVATAAMKIGVNGWRYVTGDNQLVTGDSTYFSPEWRMNQFTILPNGFVIGQNNPSNTRPEALVVRTLDGVKRVIHLGRTRGTFPVRWDAQGNVAVSFYVPDQPHVGSATAYLVQTNYAELQALPPVQDLDVSVPEIGRKLWVGWFTFEPPAVDLPRNCDLRVTQHAPYLTVRMLDGRPLYRYVAAHYDSDVDDLERVIELHKGVDPILAYWTRAAQQVRVPRGADVWGVEAYCHADESLDEFEQEVRRQVARVRRAILIAQCYTSNPHNTTDLKSLVPVFARIARDCPNVEGILAFSGSGRATGWQDHPEVHAAWRALFAGVSGMPDEVEEPPQPEPLPDEPTPPTDPIPDEPDSQPVAAIVAACT